MRDLTREYGPGKPFKDEELFSTIARLTGPEVGEFLRRHLEEPSVLPVGEWLQKAGLAIDPNGKVIGIAKPRTEQRRLRKWWVGR
ncbi:MAG: hypothetical protein IPJ85_11080 [Flavobacteriales bacterium]|nr:hypothetical protein [Flavobacteriales bacterium]